MNWPRALLLFAGVLTLALPSMSAYAQSEAPTGSRIPRAAAGNHTNNRTISDEDRGLRAAIDFGRCVVINQKEKVRELLAGYSVDVDPSQLRRLLNDGCLVGGDLRMPQATWRGVLFRQLFIEDFGNKSVVYPETGADYAIYFTDLEQSQNRTAYLLLDFAGCVTRADPENTRKFVTGIPGEPSEAAALNALLAQLGPCLPEGLEAKFSKSMLAAYLAEALYRETETALAATQSDVQ